MKKLIALVSALVFALVLLAAATPAEAKVCYKCSKYTPARYVCANKDTFRARKAARKLCKWSSYTSTCNCWKRVKPNQRSFMRYVMDLLATPRR
jgi:hypothetical protein